MCGKKTQESNFTPESVTKEFWRDNEHFADLTKPQSIHSRTGM